MLNSSEGRPDADPADFNKRRNRGKMKIETERLIIRSIRRGDEIAYAEMAKDGSLSEIGFDKGFHEWMEGWIKEALELTEKDDPRADYIPCTILRKSTGEIIGNVGCTFYEDMKKVGICYFAGAAFRGMGYIAEAGKAYISYFFEHYNESEIIAAILDSNSPSWRTAEKIGFELSGIKRYKDAGEEEEHLYRFYTIKR